MSPLAASGADEWASSLPDARHGLSSDSLTLGLEGLADGDRAVPAPGVERDVRGASLRP